MTRSDLPIADSRCRTTVEQGNLCRLRPHGKHPIHENQYNPKPKRFHATSFLLTPTPRGVIRVTVATTVPHRRYCVERFKMAVYSNWHKIQSSMHGQCMTACRQPFAISRTRFIRSGSTIFRGIPRPASSRRSHNGSGARWENRPLQSCAAPGGSCLHGW